MDFFETVSLAKIKAETRLIADKDEGFAARWNNYFPMPPKELIDSLIAGTPYKAELAVTLNSYGQGAFNLKLRDDKNAIVAELDRTIMLDHGAIRYDSMLINSGYAGRGLGRQLEANAFKVYDRLGISRIEIEAGGTIGAYTWARFGFLPDDYSWKYLAERMRYRFDQIADTVSPTTKAVVSAALTSPNPRALWLIVDLRDQHNGKPLAVALLKDMPRGWDGRFNLSDKDQRARFAAYTAGTNIEPANKQKPIIKRIFGL